MKLFTSTYCVIACALLGLRLGTVGAEKLHKKILFDSSQHEQEKDAGNSQRKKLYMVKLEDDPVVVASAHDLEGIRRRARHVVEHVRYLKGKIDEVVAGEDDPVVMNTYSYAFHGFSAQMTEAQVESLKAKPGVVKVWENEIVKLDTNSPPSILGLTQEGQAWTQGYTGEDVGKYFNV